MRIGYVPTTPPVWPRVRADEWLELFAREAGLHGKPLRAAVAQALELAGIAGDSGLDALPAGRAKRLLFGRALLHGPEVLVADDPFGGLDHEERSAIERLFLDFHLGGRTVVAALDHDADPRSFTHLAILADGRLRGFGPAVRESFDDGRRRWRYRIGCAAAAEDAAPLLRRLGIDTRVVDADTVECRHATGRLPMSELVAALVRGGIAVESAGFAPPWTAQLVDDDG
jgi:ABC-2 type transport system ATP-binding protein